jgi:hypothetical protein
MTVVELIQALVPYGDEAEVRVAVVVRGQTLYYGPFELQSDQAQGVDIVVHLNQEHR